MMLMEVGDKKGSAGKPRLNLSDRTAEAIKLRNHFLAPAATAQHSTLLESPNPRRPTPRSRKIEAAMTTI